MKIRKVEKVENAICYNAVTVEVRGRGLFENLETDMTQVGDYVVEEFDPITNKWGVRMAGATEWLSSHPTEKDALAKIKLYQAADDRRRSERIRERLTPHLKSMGVI